MQKQLTQGAEQMPTAAILAFTIEPLEFPWGTESKVVPVLDDRDLIDLVAEYERGHDFHMPGAYGGLWPIDFETGAPEEYLMWDLEAGIPRERYLLGCTCSVAGCWPLLATVSLADGFIIW